jgi:hypothetical protein
MRPSSVKTPTLAQRQDRSAPDRRAAPDVRDIDRCHPPRIRRAHRQHQIVRAANVRSRAAIGSPLDRGAVFDPLLVHRSRRGLEPAMPHECAGTRILPPMSVPIPSGDMPPRSRSRRRTSTPGSDRAPRVWRTRRSGCAPRCREHRLREVGAADHRAGLAGVSARSASSLRGGCAARARQRLKPAMSSDSFTDTGAVGAPRTSPSPRRISSSAFRAAAEAPHVEDGGERTGPYDRAASMRSECAFVTSSEETPRRRRSRQENSVADLVERIGRHGRRVARWHRFRLLFAPSNPCLPQSMLLLDPIRSCRASAASSRRGKPRARGAARH